MFIKVKDKETGYSAVKKYIEQYWNDTTWNTTIVEIEISYDNKNWDRIKEIVYPTYNCRDMEWLYDWWEGQTYINLIGMIVIDEINIPPLKENN